MNEFILYLLKASLGIIVFYIVYWATLRKETFFKANRIFLVSSLIAALILPFIGYTYTTYISNVETGNIFVELNKNFNSISNIAVQSDSVSTQISWQNALLIIYITGLILFLARLIWQCTDLIILISKHGLQKVNGLSIVQNNKYGIPFSFFSIVFINPNLHSGTDLTNILAHEKVHIRENHWFDLLIVELLTIIFWFNPFVWLFERSIKQNHEYLADEGVLAQGLSVGRYQAILINQIMGMQIIGLTNNLNYSLNKKRMKMMTKMKTPKIRAFRMIWTLPAVALLLFAFAEPSYETSAEENQESNLAINPNSQNIDIQGKVLDNDEKPLSGASIVLGGTSFGTMTNEDGNFTIKMTKTDKIYISFIGYVTLIEDIASIEKAEKVNGVYKPVFKMKTGVIKLNIEEMLKETPRKNEEYSYSSKSKNEEVFVIVEEMPDYPDGMNALANEIKEGTSKLKLSGKIEVGLTVDETGKATDIYILGKVDEKIQTNLIKSFLELKKWSPGKQRGKAVPVSYNITISQ